MDLKRYEYAVGVACTPSLSAEDRALVREIQQGLPLVARPYAAIGDRLAMAEQEVIARLQRLLMLGYIKRMGVVVRHHELGYRANAMVVWDVPDARVRELGHCLGQFPFVTLCYRRPRRLPDWPYNLFCMIHGRSRESVLDHVDELVQRCGIGDIPHAVLFSRRRFKQRGALYTRDAGRCGREASALER